MSLVCCVGRFGCSFVRLCVCVVVWLFALVLNVVRCCWLYFICSLLCDVWCVLLVVCWLLSVVSCVVCVCSCNW